MLTCRHEIVLKTEIETKSVEQRRRRRTLPCGVFNGNGIEMSVEHHDIVKKSNDNGEETIREYRK